MDSPWSLRFCSEGFSRRLWCGLRPASMWTRQQLDPHLNSESVQALRQARLDSTIFSVFTFIPCNARRMAIWDFAFSRPAGEHAAARAGSADAATGRNRPAAELGRRMALALSAAWLRVSAYDALTTVISGTFLCIPAAVLALLSVLWNVPGALAIGLIVFPQVYRYARNLLAKAYSLPHIITARAKGLSELRILFWHVVPVAGPQLLAVAGVSVSIAVGAAIPVEALCGLAGVGQLGVAGGPGARSAAADESHDPGDARNLAGQFRGRCNRTYASRPGSMRISRA